MGVGVSDQIIFFSITDEAWEIAEYWPSSEAQKYRRRKPEGDNPNAEIQRQKPGPSSIEAERMRRLNDWMM
jgi:hypothetical protein